MRPSEYKHERQRRGLTQAALAAQLGIPRESVSRRENGTQKITEEAALAIQALPIPRKRSGTENDKVTCEGTSPEQRKE